MQFAVMTLIQSDDPTLLNMTDETDRTRVRLAIERALADRPHIIAIMSVDLAKQVMAFHDLAVRSMTGEKPAKLKDHH